MILRAAVLLLGIAAAAPVPAAAEEEIAADVRRLLADPDPEVRKEGLRALRERGDEAAMRAALPFLDDRDPFCRDYAAWFVLARPKGAAAAKLVAEKAPRASSAAGRLAAADALALVEGPEALPGLLVLCADRDPRVRTTAIDAVARRRAQAAPGAGDRLRTALTDPVAGVRAAAREALATAGGEGAAEFLEQGLADGDAGARTAAAALLAARFTDRFAAALPALVADADWGVRLAAARGAAALARTPPVEILAALLEDPRVRVADAAHDSLREISGLDLPPVRADWTGWWDRVRGTWRGGSGGKVADAERPSVATYHGLPFRSNAVLFVVDLSGSMDKPMGAVDRRPRIVVASEELARTLHALPDAASADLMAFMLEPDRALGRLQPLRGGTRAKIERWFEKQARGRRGDLGGAVVAAVMDGEADTLLLLGDGVPTAGDCLFRERIRERVRQALRLRPVAIHAVACGSRPADRQFLEDLAASTGGRCVER